MVIILIFFIKHADAEKQGIGKSKALESLQPHLTVLDIIC